MITRVSGMLGQNPLEFTVQILHTRIGAVVGTGVVVCPSGKIATCKHVLRDAGVDCDSKLLPDSFWSKLFPPKEPASGTVGVTFPRLERREELCVRAKPISYFADSKDDVVLLQIIGEVPYFVSGGMVAKIGSAGLSWRGSGNSFKAYGFRKIGEHDALMTTGKILVCVPAKMGYRGGVVQLTQVQVHGGRKLIDRGMSGSAVLDTDRDLVVGLVSEAAAPVAYAVDASVMSVSPMTIALLDERGAPIVDQQTPAFEPVPAVSGVLVAFAWNEAPKVADYFVERPNLFRALGEDWNSAKVRVSVVVGFGGVGKSWTARSWLEKLLLASGAERPDGGFWWNFTERPSADDFFEYAFRYFGSGKPAGGSQARLGTKLAEELRHHRAVLVLDGLDVLQHVTGSQLGQLTNSDLREFLQSLAQSESGTHCVITTRVPLMDLNNYSTCAFHEIPPLSVAEGCNLLEQLGVRPERNDTKKLETIVKQCGGHALSIAVLGASLAEDYDGDPKRASEFLPRKLPDLPDERLGALLRSYDKRLSEAEREFLTIFAAFRQSVEQGAFSAVLRNTSVKGLPNWQVGRLTDSDLVSMVDRLIRLQLLRREPDSGTYSLHALVRSHFGKQLNALPGTNLHALHRAIRDYYELKKKPLATTVVSLRDLAPLIEAIHHGCEARDFQRASDTFWEDISGPGRDVLIHQLGALTTDLEIVREFFPESDFEADPRVPNTKHAIWMINEVGICNVGLGNLRQATNYLERASRKAEAEKSWTEAATAKANLAAVECLLGDLVQARNHAISAGNFAAQPPASDHKQRLATRATTLQGWVALWTGDVVEALRFFEQAGQKRDGMDGSEWQLSAEGIRYGDALLTSGEPERARTVAERILRFARTKRRAPLESMASRLLGDLHAGLSEPELARESYDNAVRQARTTTRREIMIEALLGRGRHARRSGATGQAEQDLREALGNCCENGYKPFEADARNELGELLISASHVEAGRREIQNARKLYEETGYRRVQS